MTALLQCALCGSDYDPDECGDRCREYHHNSEHEGYCSHRCAHEDRMLDVEEYDR